MPILSGCALPSPPPSAPRPGSVFFFFSSYFLCEVSFFFYSDKQTIFLTFLTWASAASHLSGFPGAPHLGIT